MEKFEKQPREKLDIEFDFSAVVAARPGSTVTGHAITPDDGIVIASSVIEDAIVYLVVEGGENGRRYHLSVTLSLTTERDAALTFELDALIKVKEIGI